MSYFGKAVSVLTGVLVISVLCGPQVAVAQQEAAVFNFAFNLYQDGHYDLAFREFDKFIRDFPRSVRVPDALLYKGVSQQRLGRYDDAILTLEMLLSQYQNSLAFHLLQD